jgi:two-component system LytT family response regulator
MFLDLQMPGLDGFGVSRALTGGVMPVVIIVTAYDQYAVQAFEAGAIDYLLKPVSAERLAWLWSAPAVSPVSRARSRNI